MPKEATVIFAGTFHRTMDAKNRVTIPSDWSSTNTDAFYLLPANRRVNVMPATELARQEEELREMLPAGAARQEALRVIYGSARRVEADGQGRILVPEELCKHAELRGEVAIVGVKDRFEIWNPAHLPTAAAAETTSDEARKALEALGY
jgi:MraZ protein